MESESDLVYLGRRASEERRAAVTSGTRSVRDLHLELASAYEFRIHLLREQAALQNARAPTPSKLPLVTVTNEAHTTIPVRREAALREQISSIRSNV